MKTNVGSIDRIIRIAAGAALIVATLLDQIGPFGWLGAIPLASGLFRFCPARLLFGNHTCKTRH